jgi:cytochrome c556
MGEMMRQLVISMIIALLLAPAGLSAQQHQHRGGDTTRRGMMMEQGQGMMSEGMMMPGMAVRAFDPEKLLAQRADLGLTDEQVQRLEQLQADAKRTHDDAMASHDRYRDQMMEAMGADTPDPTTVQGLMAGAHASMGEAHWAEMHAALEAMRVLTETQRAQVRKAQPGMGMQHRRGQNRQ